MSLLFKLVVSCGLVSLMLVMVGMISMSAFGYKSTIPNVIFWIGITGFIVVFCIAIIAAIAAMWTQP